MNNPALKQPHTDKNVSALEFWRLAGRDVAQAVPRGRDVAERTIRNKRPEDKKKAVASAK